VWLANTTSNQLPHKFFYTSNQNNNMPNPNKVIVTGTGAIASAIVRALVPAGYDVSTLGLAEQGVNVFSKLDPNVEPTPQLVKDILTGKRRIDPFRNLEKYITRVRHHQLDLSNRIHMSYFNDANTVIMTAANPNSFQDETSAEKNYRIDTNSIDSAIESNVRNIVFTSSLWRTMGLVKDGRVEKPISPFQMDSAVSGNPYSNFKEQSVQKIVDLAESHKDLTFAHIDMGWYPRSSMGFPISNRSPDYLQWWMAECELQQHYLLLTNMEDNPYLKPKINRGINHFAFNGFSDNKPQEQLRHNNPLYDLSTSEELGVKHEFNVYSVLLGQDSSWRRIPIPSD
jgi:hypothetical protein